MGKKKKKKSKESWAREADPLLHEILQAEEEGDNRHALTLAKTAMEDVNATPEAKQAALATKQRLSLDPVALALGLAGAAFWGVVLYVFVIS